MAKIVKKAKATASKKAVAAPKKGSAKKSAPVKVKKAAPKPAAKKAPAKVVKSTAKAKPVAKKPVAKKPVAKKPVAKKAAPKAKVAVKKAPVKKQVTKKVVAKKTVAKVVAKTKPSAKKAPVAKKVAKNVVTSKAAKAPSKPIPTKKTASKAPIKAKTVAKVVKPAVAAIAKPVKPAVKKQDVPKAPAAPKVVKETAASKREAKAAEKAVAKAKMAGVNRLTRSAKDLPRKKSSLRNVFSDEVSFDMPAPKQNKELILSKDEKLKIKKILLAKCIEIQKNNIALAKVAMEEALASANAEKDSDGEGLSDSFRETMHATRDMHARQVHEGTNTLALLNRIQIQEHDWVKFGSVIITDYQNYFISSALGEITINDEAFITVSTLSPLFQILASKEKGVQFMFLDRMYKVLEVF